MKTLLAIIAQKFIEKIFLIIQSIFYLDYSHKTILLT
jgi:hypothetical protein